MSDKQIVRTELEITTYSREVCDWVNSHFDGEALEAAYETIRWIGKRFRMDDKLGIVTEVMEG